MKLYHGTILERLPGILAEGLKPSKYPGTDVDAFVFLTKSYDDAINCGGVVLRVDVPRSIRLYKGNFEDEYLVKRTIPPAFITVLTTEATGDLDWSGFNKAHRADW